MTKISKREERLHHQACDLVNDCRVLTEDERWFVLRHFQESSTVSSSMDGAWMTPLGLARDMSIEVGGDRVIDLCAGTGRLAWSCRDLWTRPDAGRRLVCVERNPVYVRVGRAVLPEAEWICADVFDLKAMNVGSFDCAVSNPPFGTKPIHHPRFGYQGRRHEYHVIEIAASLADYGVFLLPQQSAPFRYSGQRCFLPDQGDHEYARFHQETGITLEPGCAIDTSSYDDEWRGVHPRVEVAIADFTTARTAAAGRSTGRFKMQAGDQLSLWAS